MLLIGSQQEFSGNTFMGHVDLSAKEMNVRIATDNIQEESQNYLVILEVDLYGVIAIITQILK